MIPKRTIDMMRQARLGVALLLAALVINGCARSSATLVTFTDAHAGDVDLPRQAAPSAIADEITAANIFEY